MYELCDKQSARKEWRQEVSCICIYGTCGSQNHDRRWYTEVPSIFASSPFLLHFLSPPPPLHSSPPPLPPPFSSTLPCTPLTFLLLCAGAPLTYRCVPSLPCARLPLCASAEKRGPSRGRQGACERRWWGDDVRGVPHTYTHIQWDTIEHTHQYTSI